MMLLKCLCLIVDVHQPVTDSVFDVDDTGADINDVFYSEDAPAPTPSLWSTQTPLCRSDQSRVEWEEILENAENRALARGDTGGRGG